MDDRRIDTGGISGEHAWASRPCRGALGFTLVELLVAIAIFVTVMASVALAFNTAIRTSKQGFQNQEAYELARGTQKVLERDLSRAFTNRDHGDNFSFYGTPIGFTYVGLISADESSQPNMARVTYVIYHDPILQNVSGAFRQYTYEAKDGASVPTYQLLRYVEPGMDTLDSFPINWNGPLSTDNGGNATWDGIANAAVGRSGCPTGDTGCRELVKQAARREVWIKMLAGGRDVVAVDADGDGNPEETVTLPDAWSTILLKDPADYVVGEHIRFLRAATVARGLAPSNVAEQMPPGYFFEHILSDPVQGDYYATLFTDAGLPPMFNMDDRARYSPVAGAQPFFTYWDIGTIANDVSTTADDQVAPIAYQFWNDWRNVLANPGADGIPGNADDTPVMEDASGSPLDTRLPIAVTTDFMLFFRSPYVGAPDFNERFTQRIDLPTAARRTFKAAAVP